MFWVLHYSLDLSFSPFASPLIGAIAVPSGFFSDTNLAHIISRAQCRGSEMELLDCVHNASASVDSSCGDFDDASVVCQGTYTIDFVV